MARKSSEFVSAGYKVMRVFEKLANAVLDAGGSDEDVRMIETEPGLAQKLAEVIVSARDDFQFTDELTIEIPALPRSTLEELKERYPWIAKIERDDSPEGPVTLRLATVLKSGEDSVDGATYERRRAPKRGLLLGLQHRDWLLKNQDELPEPARAALRALLGKVYLDFPGISVVREDGDRLCPYASVFGGRWDGRWRWFGSGFDRSGRVAVSSK